MLLEDHRTLGDGRKADLRSERMVGESDGIAERRVQHVDIVEIYFVVLRRIERDAVEDCDIRIALRLDAAHRAVDLVERREAGRENDRLSGLAGSLEISGKTGRAAGRGRG